ncbi:MAG: hypothetical protein R3253_05775, partial [Longimicrobiales bacterium]|nr:hypothetical protein [Longimicrobiales bacterium]
MLSLFLAGAPAGLDAQLRDPEASPVKAAALSAVLPGAGQYVLDQDRSWAYLAVEAVGLAFYIDRRSDGSRVRNRYRDFAWTEADQRLRIQPRDKRELAVRWDLVHLQGMSTLVLSFPTRPHYRIER